MANACLVSITVPVFNEEEILRSATAEIIAAMENTQLPFELILAENGSTDLTAVLVDEMVLGDSRLRATHLGVADYGRALRSGFLASKGECLANFSIDFADVGFLQLAVDKLVEHDLVLGSKYVASGLDQRPFARRLGGKFLSGAVRLLFGLPFSDTHGLLVLRRRSIGPLVAQCRFGNEVFDTELVVRAHRAGLKILELPIQVEEKRPSRIGSLRRAARMLLQYVKLRTALWREGTA